MTVANGAGAPITKTGVSLIGSPDPCFAWDGDRLLDPAAWTFGAAAPDDIRGAAAAGRITPGGRCRLVRDPLGLNELFWSRTSAGGIMVASRPAHLVDAGRPFESIRAVPTGTVVDLDPAAGTAETRPLASGPTGPASSGAAAAQAPPLEDVAAEIRAGLDRYLERLAGAYPHARVFVCASGGLDSSGIAVLAHEHFRDVVAVSFDLERRGRTQSEDRRTARRLADDLGLPFVAVTTGPADLLDAIDTVLTEGVDWRDFNVHAGLVNAALARGIADAAPRGRPALVMTGDLANELLVDYRVESYRGRAHYRLPDVAPAALRRFLVRGLDTSNREVGPFGAWGLPVVQPYAAVADRYLALPPAFLSSPSRKADLARRVFGRRIPEYIYTRPKARAQVGDAGTERGVLGLCADGGLDTSWFRDRFARLHDITTEAGHRALDAFIRCGRYRSEIPVVTKDER